MSSIKGSINIEYTWTLPEGRAEPTKNQIAALQSSTIKSIGYNIQKGHTSGEFRSQSRNRCNHKNPVHGALVEWKLSHRNAFTGIVHDEKT